MELQKSYSNKRKSAGKMGPACLFRNSYAATAQEVLVFQIQWILLLVWILVFSLLMPSKLLGQSDSSSMMIYVEKADMVKRSIPVGNMLSNWSGKDRDFIRQLVRARIDLHDPENRCFNMLNSENSHVVNALVHGFSEGKCEGIHPGSLGPYSFIDFLYDLAYLQEEDPDEGNLNSLINWFFLTSMIDIIGEKGIGQNGIRFFRPSYLRLVWNNQDDQKDPYAVVMFSFESVLPILEKISCMNGYSLDQMLLFEQFQGDYVEIRLDETYVLIPGN